MRWFTSNHIDFKPVFLGRLGRLRSDARDQRLRMRLTSDTDQVANGCRRREHDGIETTGLDCVSNRLLRWRGTYGTECSDFFDFPSEFGQATCE